MDGYTAFAGNTLRITVDVLDEAGQPLDVAGDSLIYILRDRTGAEVLRKTTGGGGITTEGSTATIAIAAGETTGIEGSAYQELQVTDDEGNVSTLLAGYVRFTRTEIAP